MVWVAGMYRVAIRTAIIADLPILESPKLQYGFPYSRHSPSNNVCDYVSVGGGGALQRVESLAYWMWPIQEVLARPLE